MIIEPVNVSWSQRTFDKNEREVLAIMSKAILESCRYGLPVSFSIQTVRLQNGRQKPFRLHWDRDIPEPTAHLIMARESVALHLVAEAERAVEKLQTEHNDHTWHVILHGLEVVKPRKKDCAKFALLMSSAYNTISRGIVANETIRQRAIQDGICKIFRIKQQPLTLKEERRHAKSIAVAGERSLRPKQRRAF